MESLSSNGLPSLTFQQARDWAGPECHRLCSVASVHESGLPEEASWWRPSLLASWGIQREPASLRSLWHLHGRSAACGQGSVWGTLRLEPQVRPCRWADWGQRREVPGALEVPPGL